MSITSVVLSGDTVKFMTLAVPCWIKTITTQIDYESHKSKNEFQTTRR